MTRVFNMPMPTKNESKKDYLERCIPIVLHEGTAKDGSQAEAICHSMWKQHQTKALTEAWYQFLFPQDEQLDDEKTTRD
jgi:hypothetical protein